MSGQTMMEARTRCNASADAASPPFVRCLGGPASICRLHCSPSRSIFPTTEVVLLDVEKNQNEISQNQLTRDTLTIPSSINILNTGWGGTQADTPVI